MDARQKEMLRALAQLAWADGSVSTAETDLIADFAEKLGVSLVERIAEMDSGLSQPPDPTPVDLEAVLPDHESRLEAMQMLVCLCFADGQLDPGEMSYLGDIAVKLGIGAQELDAMRQAAEGGQAC